MSAVRATRGAGAPLDRARALVVAAITGLLATTSARADECQRLVDVLAPTTFGKGTHERSLANPSSGGGTFFLTVERLGAAPGRVELDGRVVVSTKDLTGPDDRLVRVQVPLRATSTLRVKVNGKAGLAVAVQGVVPEAALPQGVGRRAAFVTLLQAPRLGRVPPRVEVTRHTAPATEGLFTLRLSQGSPRALLAGARWNGGFPLVVLPGRSADEAPVRLGAGPDANVLESVVLGGPGAFVVATLSGWIVDETPPALTWTSPADGGEVTAATALALSYTDSITHVDTGTLRVLLDDAHDVTAAFDVGAAGATSTIEAVAALAPSALRSGPHVLTARVRDAACNEASAVLTYVVPDTTPPVLEQPQDLAVEQQGPAGAVVTYATPVATDDLDPSPTVVCVPASGSLFPPGATTVTCTATDDAGNQASVTFTVLVRDTTPPAIVQPADVTVEQTSPDGAVATFDLPAATDAVDPAPVVTCAPPSGTLFPPGDTTVTCTARDAAGNAAQATFVVRVRDTTPPSLALTPADGATLDSAQVSLAAAYEDPVSFVDTTSFQATVDGQDQTARFTVRADGADASMTLTAGTHVLEVRVADRAGNLATASSTFTVAPATTPVALRLTVGPPPVAPRAAAPDTDALLELAAEPRSIDGSGNDLTNPDEGRAHSRLKRARLPSAYFDGVAAPAGPFRPSPRAISNAVHAQPGSIMNDRRASDFLWMWGQFLDHDLSLTRGHTPDEPFPIQVPQGDPFFDPSGTGLVTLPLSRSRFDPASSPREQVNELTAWIDGSMIYGSDPARALALRANDGTGRLKTSPGGFLPPNVDSLDNAPTRFDPSFGLAGDIRASETTPLLALHTLFVREHNHWADRLKAKFPQATDEQLYQAARRIVWAEVQVISYKEFLGTLLGPGALAPYSGYRPELDVGVENAFANAAFRLGHTLLSPRLLRLDHDGNSIGAGSLGLLDSFFTPARLTDGGGIEPLLRGGAHQLAQELDHMVVEDVRSFLFGRPGAGGQDLPALNVQRGRDHGLPTYNEARIALGLGARDSFAEVSSDPVVVARLASVYQDVNDIDLWTGGVCEDHVPGAMLGEVFHALFKHQFELVRDGDRFWYQRHFSGEALAALESTRLSDVIRRNTTIGAELSNDVFMGALVPFLENDFTVRAVTESGATATTFEGFVLVSVSDGKDPLHGLLVEVTAADQGQVTVPRVAFFQTLGDLVISARTVPVEPDDVDVSGSLAVSVALQEPLIYPPLPATVASGDEVVVSGLAPPGEEVQLLVDGQLVATTTAGPSGDYTLTAVLPPGEHVVQTRALDPVSREPETSFPQPVTVTPPPTLELVVTPDPAVVAVGRSLELTATERFLSAPDQVATTRVTWHSLDPTIATVDAAGVLRGVKAGQTTVRATLVAGNGTFTDDAQVAVGGLVLLESSPVHGEQVVATNRETILRFSAPLDVASITTEAIFAQFGGERLPARLHASPDRTVVTVFYEHHLPASSRVRVTVVGDLLRDPLGNPVDADRDDQPGGTALIDFDTHSLTLIPGTANFGRVFATQLAFVGSESITVPLEGVKISVEGAEDTLFTFTDQNGDYRLEPCPAGKFFVLIDGRTAINQVPPGAYYAPVGKSFVGVPGEEANMGTAYLPLVAAGTLRDVSMTEDTEVTFHPDLMHDHPDIAGTRVIVPADSLYADDGTRGGQVGIAPVPPDRLPGALSPDLDFKLVISVQTDGATNFDRPLAVRFPNLEGLAPGEKTALWSFNHDTGNWEIIGSMTVTADGLFVETDPGVGILAPGWHSWRRGVQGDGANPGEGEEGEEEEGEQEDPECPSDVRGYADCVCKDPDTGSVILSSGEEVLDRTDLVIPGRAGHDFVMRRRYRSRFTYDGPLGYGWDFDFNEKLFIRDNGDVARMSGDGRNNLWVRRPDGSFQAPHGYFGTLEQRSDGVYVITERDGFKRLFQPNGRLFCWLDRYGNQMAFEHDACGDLDFVLDVYGRIIDFTFTHFANGKARLTRIEDFAGRTIVYTYDQGGNLTSVRSPIVTGTSTGNNFPAGRTERYTYSSGFSDARLNHNLLTVTAPEEVARGGPPFLTITYGTDPADQLTFDKVIARQEGGTNASGVPAGGTTTYAYVKVNENVPPGDLTVLRTRITVVDRNGNKTELYTNEHGDHILTRRFTRGLRSGEPEFYETRSEFDDDGQLVRRVFPEGNELRFRYGTASRADRKNIVEIRKVAGPRGDGHGNSAADLVTSFTYEPLFNQVLTVTDPRGLVTRTFYDYQEGNADVPFAQELGIDPNTIPRGLGDLNGDGATNFVAGNAVRVEAPTVTLDPGSHEAARRGSTLQPIVTQFGWNVSGQPTFLVDEEGNVTTFDYHPDNDPDGDGVLTSSPWRRLTSARRGYRVSTTVDATTSARRTSQSAPLALTTVYRYDPVGNVVAETNPRGITTRVEVNDLDEIVQVTRGADVSLAVLQGQLFTGESAFGYRVRNYYDFNGRVVKVEEENRDGTTVGVGSFVETETVYDILHHPIETRLELDATTRLITRFRYDPNENLAEVIAPEGNRVVTVYDERDQRFTVTRGAGSPEASTLEYHYDKSGKVARHVDPEDTDGDGQREQHTFIYDGFDRETQQIDAVGMQTITHYDQSGNFVRVEAWGHGPNGPDGPAVLLSDTRFGHDELNRIVRTDSALFISQGFTTNRPVTPRDHDGDGFVTTKMEYDALSRETFVVEDDQQVMTTVYDGASRVVEQRDVLGNRTLTSYDRNSNPTVVRSIEVSADGLVPAESFATVYVYDQLDRVVRVTDNAGQSMRMAYDSRDNVVATSDPVGAPIADPLGIVPAPGTTNGPGNTQRFTFDGASRMTRVVADLRVGGTGAGVLDTTNPANPDGQVTLSYVFDKNSRLTAVVDDNGSATSYKYDALDRQVEEVFADGAKSVVVYDREDNVRQHTDPNGSVKTCTYDRVNRLVRCEIARGPGVSGTTLRTWTYDGLGRTTRSTDDNGGTPATTAVVERTYDSVSRDVEERLNGRAVSRDWRGDSVLLSITYPGGRRLDHTYDAIDRIRAVHDAGREVYRNAHMGGDERLLRRTHGNGTTLSLLDPTGTQAAGFDRVQRIVRLRHTAPDSAAFVDREYAYNAVNMRTVERRHDDLGLTDRYTYDSVYRVVRTDYDQDGLPGAPQRDLLQTTYRFDGVGNRRQTSSLLTSVPAAVIETYQVNALNQYTKRGELVREHDANGNVTADGLRTYLFDADNRLVAAFDQATGIPIARYEYDAEHRRTRKVVFKTDAPGQLDKETLYFYDRWQLVEEQSASGATEVTYVYSDGMDEHVQFERTPAHPLGAGAFYVHQDVRGDVVAVTDSAGAVVERYRYDDYGRPDRTSAVGNPHLFQGARLDEETGLYWIRHRYYDPITGRFVQRDPMFDESNVGNQYTFAGNNPISNSDPLGLDDFVDEVFNDAMRLQRRNENLLSKVGCYAWEMGKFTVSFALDFVPAVGIAKMTAEGLLGRDLITGRKLSGLERLFKFVPVAGKGVGRAADKFSQAAKAANAAGKGGAAGSKGLNVGGKPCVGNRPVSPGVGLGSSRKNGCFLAGTLVLTAEGMVPIEKVKVGDHVVSRDDKTGDVASKPVVRVFEGWTAEVCRVRVAKALGRTEPHTQDGSATAEESDEPPSPDQELRSTPGHPIWRVGSGFIRADALKAGDELLSDSGERLLVVSVTVIRELAQTYNLEVAETHTYFVQGEGGSSPVWVHNAGGSADPWDIHFSHPISTGPDAKFAHGPWAGRSLSDAVEATRQLGRLPPGFEIEAQMVNNQLVSANNRTLYIAQEANIPSVNYVDKGGQTFHKLQRNFRESGIGGPLEPYHKGVRPPPPPPAGSPAAPNKPTGPAPGGGKPTPGGGGGGC